jgi:hypothetical protein
MFDLKSGIRRKSCTLSNPVFYLTGNRVVARED